MIEIFLSRVLCFPKYGVKEKIIGIRNYPILDNIYEPYSKYWKLEGEYEVLRRNNIGLPGIDIDTSRLSKYICVLGASFIENYYVKPELMSTSVFHNLVKNIDVNSNVLNLGYNGDDPYFSYRRIAFYESKYKTDYVILVIHGVNSGSYKLFKNPFYVEGNSFYKDETFKTEISLFLRNKFSFFRLFASLFQNHDDGQTVEPKEYNNDAENIDMSDLFLCLTEFNKRYNGKFMCISIMNSELLNNRIKEYCSKNSINFDFKNLLTQEYQIKGDWHLNEKGNRILGNLLFDSYVKFKNISK